MTRIVSERLSFAFSDRAPLFEGSSFVVSRGFVGLVGENGAGKSTLLSLIAAKLRPSSGLIRIEPAEARVCVVEQTLPETVEPLSPGQRKRDQIRAALEHDPDVLLLDEPTNHLDAAGRQWLLEELARFDGIGVIVSHDRELLGALTSKTLRVHRGTLTIYTGPYERARLTWQAEAEQALAARRRTTEHVAALGRRLQAAKSAQRASTASRNAGRRMKNRHDSDARSALAQTRADWADGRHGRKITLLRREIERARDRLEEHELDKQLGRSVFARFRPAPNPFVAVRDAGPLKAGERVLLSAPALTVRRDDRIWIAGPNGSGKTTLIGELCTRMRLPPEHVLMLPQELSAARAAALLASVRELSRAELGQVMSVVAALGVDPDRLLASSSPSPGEARKLAIALGLGKLVRIVVLDEPTNHLDLPSVERLEAALAAYPGALVLATHDAILAQRVSRTRWELSASGVAVSAL